MKNNKTLDLTNSDDLFFIMSVDFLSDIFKALRNRSSRKERKEAFEKTRAKRALMVDMYGTAQGKIGVFEYTKPDTGEII